MPEIPYDTFQLQLEADRRTDWERQRLDYYLCLRYEFSPCDVDYWLDSLYTKGKVEYKPEKKPSWNQIRKEAGIGLLENIGSFVLGENEEELKRKKAVAQKRLQDRVDKKNADNRERCNKHNAELNKLLQNKLNRLTSYEATEIEEYFTFVLDQDSYRLNENDHYVTEYCMIYDSEKRQLVVDYKLPVMQEIPRVKEWRLDKNNLLVPKDMNKTDYLEMYERILFDISLRIVAMLFESDSNNVLKSIVFNGSCMYNEWQEKPRVLISFVMSKSTYSSEKIRSMDCISKAEVAKLNEVRYLDDINSQKPPAGLWETPPSKLVFPIRSSM